MSHKNDTSYQIISARNQKIKKKLPFLPYLFKYTIFQNAAANILCVFIYMTLREEQKYRDRKQLRGSHGLRAEGGVAYKGNEGNVRVLCVFWGVGYLNICVCQSSSNSTPKRVNFTVYKLKKKPNQTKKKKSPHCSHNKDETNRV